MPYPLVVNDAGVIEPRPIDPAEKFVNASDSSLSENNILDYWVWASSDLVGNTERGVLAEYLVAMAVGAERPVRNLWGAYDIDAPDGTKIEVKSAAYVQSWYQKHLSRIQFGIRKTLEWIPEKNDFGKERKRQSDLYVFCLLAQKEKHHVNPLDLEQWEFYVIPTCVLDKEFDDRQSISLNQVREYSHAYSFRQLQEAGHRLPRPGTNQGGRAAGGKASATEGPSQDIGSPPQTRIHRCGAALGLEQGVRAVGRDGPRSIPINGAGGGLWLSLGAPMAVLGSGGGAGSAGQHAGEDNRGPGRCDSVGRLSSLVDGSGAVGAVRQAMAGLAIEPGRE